MPSAARQRLVLRDLSGPAAMNASLWACQTVAALALASEGLRMITLSLPELDALHPSSHTSHLASRPWFASMSLSQVHVVGFFVLVFGFGIVAPSWVRIAPKLAGIVAVSLAVLLSLTAIMHGLRGETWPLVLNVGLVAMLLFIAWGRIVKSPIEPHAHIRC